MTINSVKDKLLQVPKTRLYIYGAVALLVLIYLAWSLCGSQPQQPSAGFVAAVPAVTAPKVDGPIVKVPLKIVPKKKVKEDHPDAHIDAPGVEVIDTAIIPQAPNGAVTITTLDTTTGVATTEVKIKPAPWFALERTNYAGIGYELHWNGDQKAKGYYKRDLVRIKDAHLQAEAQIRIPVNGSDGKAEGFIGGNLEYRF